MAKELELLAPAGAPPILKAVIGAGADAVYVGGSRFGARAYAPNFDEEALLWAIDYAHLYGRKLYLAVNTLLKEQELQQLSEYLLPYYRQGLDAVIVQDFGVMRQIRRDFPDLPVHASTQMTVVSGHGAKLLAEAGASRVVLARELSLEEIAQVRRDAGVELEVFVHGAICYCYSGQCLFSSLLGGRSGNRGRCAQPCRLPYGIGEEQPVYPLSPKDLCAVGLLPQLAESGVFSFKIEGRMKQAEYAAGVVSVYREYLDRYLALGREGYAVRREDRQKLLDLGSRSGFTEGFLTGQGGADMITSDQPCHIRAKEEAAAPACAFTEPKLGINGRFSAEEGHPAALTVASGSGGFLMTVTGETAVRAKRTAVTEASLREKLCKTGNTPFEFESLEIRLQDGLFLPVSSVNEMRRQALDGLKEQCLKPYRRQTPRLSDGRAGLEEERLPGPSEGPVCVAASAETKEQLSVLLKTPFLSCIYTDSAMFARNELVCRMREIHAEAKRLNKQVYFILPAVFRHHTSVFYSSVLPKLSADGFLVKSYDALGFLLSRGIDPARIRLDYSLYTWSNAARAAFWAYGISGDTVPAELNRREIAKRQNAASEMVVYGALPLMVSAHCIVRNKTGCSHTPGVLELKDRYGVLFPVKNNCAECYNVIYNSRPLDLSSVIPELAAAGLSGYRLSFTTETGEQVRSVIRQFAKSCFGDGAGASRHGVCTEFTYGHYKRGVE